MKPLTVLAYYSTVCSMLDDVHETGNDACAVKAGGLLVQLEKFNTFLGLKLCYLVFSTSEQLSITLQGKDTTIQDAKGAAKLPMAFLERQRTESAYDEFYDRLVEQCHDLNDEPVLPGRHNLLEGQEMKQNVTSLKPPKIITDKSIMKFWMLSLMKSPEGSIKMI